MARITVEDCLVQVTNRFSLARLASTRAKQLLEGDAAVTDTRGNKAVVSALREIADAKVKFKKQKSGLDKVDQVKDYGIEMFTLPDENEAI